MILIGGPVHNRAYMLENYLDKCLDQDYEGEVKLFFIANNCTDGTEKILQTYKNKNLLDFVVMNNPKVIPDKRIKQERRSNIYYWLAHLRNKMLDKAIELQADYFLSCDSDIFMRPDTLSRLLEHNLPAVSALVYNGYLHCPDEPWRYPNILKWNGETYKHQATYWVKNSAMAPYGKLVATDFTGACMLIRKDMFKYRYAYYLKGEDEPFCRSVREHGLFCDISLFNYHNMK